MRSNPVLEGQHTSYVPSYRTILRQPWIASPHNIGTYRKCGGGFAKTVRRDGAPRAGRRPALSRRNAPGRWTELRRAMRGEGGFETRPYELQRTFSASAQRNPPSKPSSLIFDI
ncbi:MAG: hypothetical protein LBM98_04900 [Oscillospiraceae bacterium]|nr:hypothetical protein [Oscillospiraceae bacterium]